MNHQSQKIAAIFLIIVTVIVLTLSSQIFTSSLHSIKTSLFLEEWQQTKTKPKELEWTTAFQASLNAQQTHPIKDAFIEERIGKVIQWKTFSEAIENPKAIAERKLALTAYQNQTLLTPNWPNAWFNLLDIKIELNEYDNEFYQAYSIAEQTTKQTPNMHTKFVLINVKSWQNLNSQTKNKALKLFIAEAGNSPKHSDDLRQLLQAYNLLLISCIYSKVNQQNTYNLCKQ